LLGRRWIRRLVFLAAVGGIALPWAMSNEFRRSYLPAQLGWPKAQYIVGAAYKAGDSVTQDYTQAAKWFRRAAQSNMPEAQFEFGVLRLNGLGIEPNRDEALGYLRKAAEAGIVEAQFLAATVLLDEADHSDMAIHEADRWLRLAAGSRYAPAQFCLANEYIAGTRLGEDYVAADILLNDLVGRDFKPAQPVLEHLRDSLMSEDQKTAAQAWEAEHGNSSNNNGNSSN